jgi:Ankyrin repeats (3 copies)
MLTLTRDDPLAIAVRTAIQTGDLEALSRLLRENPDLARARVGSKNDATGQNGGRTLLHIATDWPGHFPNGPALVAAIIAAGADVNAPSVGAHEETPLHWAASSDDVAVLDALLDQGADIEAPGSVIDGRTALADAVAFGQWQAARRLIQRGAKSTLWQSAALGLLDRVAHEFAGNAAETGRRHERVLVRLSRRTARSVRVPARPRGRSQLDRIRQADSPRRRAAERGTRTGRLARHAGSEVDYGVALTLEARTTRARPAESLITRTSW